MMPCNNKTGLGSFSFSFSFSNAAAVVASILVLSLSSSGSQAFVTESYPRTSIIPSKEESSPFLLAAYLDTELGASSASASASTPAKETSNTLKNNAVVDTATLGTLNVPQVGLGTISWSTDSGKLKVDTYCTVG
jgi:hypothetical protein